MKFIYGGDYDSDTRIEYETSAVILDEVLAAFERFLLAVGYHFKGHLDFVDDGEVIDE